MNLDYKKSSRNLHSFARCSCIALSIRTVQCLLISPLHTSSSFVQAISSIDFFLLCFVSFEILFHVFLHQKSFSLSIDVRFFAVCEMIHYCWVFKGVIRFLFSLLINCVLRPTHLTKEQKLHKVYSPKLFN